MPPAVRSSRSLALRDGLVVLLGTAGAGLLGLAFARPGGSAAFAVLVVGAAACWLAGAFAAGPLPLGRRAVGEPLLVAAVLFGGFALADRLVRAVPSLHGGVGDVLAIADARPVAAGLTLALVGGLAEEPLFRGGLWDVLARRLPRVHPGVGTTLLYGLMVGATSRNAALTLAALVLSAVVAWQRVRAGGLLAPMVVHGTWSVLVLLLLPR